MPLCAAESEAGLLKSGCRTALECAPPAGNAWWAVEGREDCLWVGAVLGPGAWLSVWVEADGSNFTAWKSANSCLDTDQLWAGQSSEEVVVLTPSFSGWSVP